MLVVPPPTLQKHWHNIFFKGLLDDDMYNIADSLHLQAACFSFGGLLQRNLGSVVEYWNTNLIRPSNLCLTRLFFMRTPLKVMRNKDLKTPDKGFFRAKKKNRKFTFVWLYSFSLPDSKAFKLIKLEKILRFVINTGTIVWLFYYLHACTIKEGWVRQR